MCGSFGISTPENILERYDVKSFGNWQASYNIRPAQGAPIITRNSPLTGHIATFGFIPSWSKEVKPKIMPINARAETVSISGLFKGAFLHSRCIVPAQFWYEWVKTEVQGKIERHPYAFKVKDQKMFGFAGIYSLRKDAGGIEHYTFAIITTKPNKVAGKIHDRMPVVLHPDDESIWLDEDAELKELMSLLIAYEANETEVWPVSQKVNSFKNDGPELLEKV